MDQVYRFRLSVFDEMNSSQIGILHIRRGYILGFSPIE